MFLEFCIIEALNLRPGSKELEAFNVERVRGYLECNLGCKKKEVIRPADRVSPCLRSMSPEVALRVISRQCSASVAFRVKRTLSRLPLTVTAFTLASIFSRSRLVDGTFGPEHYSP
jgi:hypothetical protein